MTPGWQRKWNVFCWDGNVGCSQTNRRRGERGKEVFRGQYVYIIPCKPQVNELHPGKYFGELALVNHAPRQATVVARDDVKVACECFLISGNYLTKYRIVLFDTLPHYYCIVCRNFHSIFFCSPGCASLWTFAGSLYGDIEEEWNRIERHDEENVWFKGKNNTIEELRMENSTNFF